MALMQETETGDITGTRDKDYNIIWFTEQCLSNALRLEIFAKDAEREGDDDLAEFFRKAQTESKKGAEKGKDMLRSRV
jgi:rubrerythrin